MIEVLSERALVRKVSERWYRTHTRGKGEWSKSLGGPKSAEQIYRELAALNLDTADHLDIAAIIGNDSWAGKPTCDQCRRDTYECVRIGEPWGYESNTATLCRACLQLGIDALDGDK